MSACSAVFDTIVGFGLVNVQCRCFFIGACRAASSAAIARSRCRGRVVLVPGCAPVSYAQPWPRQTLPILGPSGGIFSTRLVLPRARPSQLSLCLRGSVALWVA